MKKFLSAIVLSSALLAAPLAHADSQDGMAAGAVVGATTGAIVGSNSDQAVQGALVGAVFGTIAGAILADDDEPVYVREYRPHREYREHRREYEHHRYVHRAEHRFDRISDHRERTRHVGYRGHGERR